MQATRCPTCKTGIVQSAGARGGRPRRFCSERCKRLAEFKIRRLQNRILTLELQDDQYAIASQTWNKKAREHIAQRIQELLDELMELAVPHARDS